MPSAAADESVIHTLGTAAPLVNGDVVQAWTIADLKPSRDTIPYPVAGTLWEATATDVAVQGGVQPVVSNLNARARSGQTYRVLFGVATPQGVNPAALSQGQQTSGKVYFDVTGDVPDSVVYNAGGPDLAVWVQAPPVSPRPAASRSGASSSSSAGTASGTVPPAPLAPAPGPAPAITPTSQGTPTDPGSVGTPVAPGSAGTPVPGTAGTPVAPQSQGTPVPGSAGTPAPPTSVGTPATEATPSVTAPAPTAAPAPPAASSAGAPAVGSPTPTGQPAVVPSTTVAPSA